MSAATSDGPGPTGPAPLVPAAGPAGDLATEVPRRGAPAGAPMVLLGLALVVVALGLIVLGRRGGLAGSEAGAAPEPYSAAFEAPICSGTAERWEERLGRGFELVRLTPEGRRLARQLADEEVCVGVEQLAYNGGYAAPVRGLFGGWSGSVIMIDEDALVYADDDILAAILVHEAAHMDRAIRGEECRDECTVLPNGVHLEEEVAAHGAEAEWWLARFGVRGRLAWGGYGHSIDALAAAYRQGPEAFRAHVADLRDDPREGQGL